MATLGAQMLPSYALIDEAMRRYREAEQVDPVFERLLGNEVKREQYRLGRAFCDYRGGTDRRGRRWLRATRRRPSPSMPRARGATTVARSKRVSRPGDWVILLASVRRRDRFSPTSWTSGVGHVRRTGPPGVYLLGRRVQHQPSSSRLEGGNGDGDRGDPLYGPSGRWCIGGPYGAPHDRQHGSHRRDGHRHRRPFRRNEAPTSSRS